LNQRSIHEWENSRACEKVAPTAFSGGWGVQCRERKQSSMTLFCFVLRNWKEILVINRVGEEGE
jgi:hypothetical protein